MKAVGALRKIDPLGRVTIPKKVLNELSMGEGTQVEFYVDDEDRIVLQRYQKGCVFCGKRDGLFPYRGKLVCDECLIKVNRLAEVCFQDSDAKSVAKQGSKCAPSAS